MKAYLTLIWYFTCFYAGATGTGTNYGWVPKDTILSKNIIITRYYEYKDNKLFESGIIIKGNKIQCGIEASTLDYVFAFGNPVSVRPILFFDCATNQPGKTFNGRQNGQKVGIWFSWYLWGGVRRATMYLDGQRSTVVYFRPNGKLARMLNFKNGKRRKSGNALYDKQGNIIGGRIRF